MNLDRMTPEISILTVAWAFVIYMLGYTSASEPEVGSPLSN